MSDDDRASVAGEVSNLLMARLHASFSERSLKSEVSSPVLAGGGQVATPVDGEGLLIGLAISGAGEFFVSLLASNKKPDAAVPAASPEATAV
jgi:CheY-specific phosphatase CheX